MMNQSETEAFWAQFESEIGEKIVSRTMGQHFREKRDQGEWGLLVLTETTLRFRPTPGENWFDSLFRMATPKVPRKPLDDTVIPLSAIRSLILPRKRFFDLLFSPPYLMFTLVYEAGGMEHSILLGADAKCDLLKNLLSSVPVSRAP
ncbi:MAG: hypothetical protein N3A02_00675 [Rectinema sp.]|nr:hypothetical protein [Rectinema sp.]